nr:MAG TPA: hypothetical protein [Caudoviricetes sp.]
MGSNPEAFLLNIKSTRIHAIGFSGAKFKLFQKLYHKFTGGDK